MRLYIIRHAEPDYENDTITAKGHTEAQALAERMAKERLSRIYVSPLGRAQATADYTVKATRLKPTTEPWTAEIADCAIDHPRLGWMTMWDCPGEDIRANSPFPSQENWHQTRFLDKPIFRQTFERLQKHSDEFLARHGYERQGGRYRCVAPNRERIAIFCHGGFGLTWLAHLLEISAPMFWSGFWLSPSSVTTVLMDERSDEWAVPRCIGVADTCHLYKAGIPVSPHGIKANFD